MHGAAPNEVADNDELRAELRKKNADYAQFNKERSEKRAVMIEETGQFRAMTSKGGAFTRGFKPRYEGVLRQAEEVKGPRAADESGNTFLTKFVQPVKEATVDTGPVRIEQRGSAQTRARQHARFATVCKWAETISATCKDGSVQSTGFKGLEGIEHPSRF